MIEDLLVGSTGFVGGNLMQSHTFGAACHSTDVGDYYGACPTLCVYCGVPAAMYLANANPEADLDIMRQARENLRKINAKKTVLISSIAVYADSRGMDEKAGMRGDGLPAYGRNRLQLERWVREDFPDSLIVRLPALYGVGLKKNFLFDLHTITPAMLKDGKYMELQEKSDLVRTFYALQGNGFYALKSGCDKNALRSFFEGNDFNALSFTDSRSRYQFYNLSRLMADIRLALENGIELVNLATAPLSARDIYEAVTGKSDWSNILDKEPFDYDMRTAYAAMYGGADGYLVNVGEELDDICKFMEGWEM